MTKLNYNKQLLLVGLIFSLHNTEETIGFSHFVYASAFPFQTPSSSAMTTSIVLVTLIAWGVILWAFRQPATTVKRNILTAFTSVFLFNAFIPHITGAIALHRYVPGVITAVLLFLPYSFWLMPRLYHSYAAGKWFYTVAGIGLGISGVIVVILQVVANLCF